VRYELEKEVSKYGNAGVPENIPAEFRSEIDQSLKYAFVDTFRLLMFICAGMAALLVKPRIEPLEYQQQTKKKFKGKYHENIKKTINVCRSVIVFDVFPGCLSGFSRGKYPA
jgi:hypothetical protein